MHRTIDFPNIGIHLTSVGDHITIFGFDIAYYGIIIGLGILAGLLIAVAEAKRSGQNPEVYYDLVIYAVIFSIIGARLYYVVFSWDMYKDDLKSILNIRQGGLAIYGGVIAAIITVFVFARVRKLSPYLIFDTAGLGLVAGQMIGRWGNFFNREAFGEYTDSLLAMRLPEDAVRQSDITELMRQNMETIRGVNYIQV
ncbi:MAG: prolipoprotein diacylglyceryl transferase, partial [Dorea sp.]